MTNDDRVHVLGVSVDPVVLRNLDVFPSETPGGLGGILGGREEVVNMFKV
jgi:hypothetical protein